MYNILHHHGNHRCSLSPGPPGGATDAAHVRTGASGGGRDMDGRSGTQSYGPYPVQLMNRHNPQSHLANLKTESFMLTWNV